MKNPMKTDVSPPIHSDEPLTEIFPPNFFWIGMFWIVMNLKQLIKLTSICGIEIKLGGKFVVEHVVWMRFIFRTTFTSQNIKTSNHKFSNVLSLMSFYGGHRLGVTENDLRWVKNDAPKWFISKQASKMFSNSVVRVE